MITPGEVLTGEVLEVKEKGQTAVIKFGKRPIEARVLADLKTGEQVKVRVKGWHNGKLLLRVLKKKGDLSGGSIDVKA
mgnify:CR=1 FL=1